MKNSVLMEGVILTHPQGSVDHHRVQQTSEIPELSSRFHSIVVVRDLDSGCRYLATLVEQHGRWMLTGGAHVGWPMGR